MITPKLKQCVYFTEEMLKEMQQEAIRQDRSLSWIVQRTWRVACADVRQFPGGRDSLVAKTKEPTKPTELAKPEPKKVRFELPDPYLTAMQAQIDEANTKK